MRVCAAETVREHVKIRRVRVRVVGGGGGRGGAAWRAGAPAAGGDFEAGADGEEPLHALAEVAADGWSVKRVLVAALGDVEGVSRALEPEVEGLEDHCETSVLGANDELAGA